MTGTIKPGTVCLILPRTGNNVVGNDLSGTKVLDLSKPIKIGTVTRVYKDHPTPYQLLTLEKTSSLDVNMIESIYCKEDQLIPLFHNSAFEGEAEPSNWNIENIILALVLSIRSLQKQNEDLARRIEFAIPDIQERLGVIENARH